MPFHPPTALGAAWSRLLRALRPERLDIVFTPEYQLTLGGTPIDPHRAEFILSYLFSRGLIGRKSPHVPRRASLSELMLVHEQSYLDELRDPRSLVPVVGFEVSDEIHHLALDAQRFAVGGTLRAARRAVGKARLAVNLGGGLHHARPDGGRGFCIFNDVAVAIAVLRREGFEGPVLVVDLDLHDGDGTRLAFAKDPSVFTFSIHNRTWDDAAARASLTLELGGEVEDAAYLGAVERHLPRLLDEVEPQLVFFNAGVDPAHDDQLGNWRISKRGMLRRDRFVLSEIQRRELPSVMVLGGGYGHRAWTYTARTLAWVLAGWEDPELPSRTELTLSRYRRLFGFEGAPGSGGLTESAWELTEDDVYGELGAAPKKSRLLDYFSPHGIELVLERAGLFERLRAAGFPHPTLNLDLENPAGQTLQITGDPQKSRRLVEIRMRRNRTVLPGFDLLDLEWLLLQNPGAEFTAHRPRLPGQKHPGLGILADVMALLVLLCEQLHLDGVTFVPSHYHLAAQGKKYLRFARPEDEAWFAAVAAAVEGLPLAEATRVVERGELLDAERRPVLWRPMSMVLPVSRRLREHLEDAARHEEARGAGAGLAFSRA